MKNRNSIAIVLVLSFFTLILSAPQSSYAKKVTKTVHKTFSLNRGGMVSLSNVNGGVEITSWNKESVDVTAEIEVKYGNRRRAEDFLKKVEVLFDHDKDNLDIEVDYPRRHNSNFLSWLFGEKNPGVSVRFTIKVPREVDLDLHTVNGKLRVEDVAGDIKAGTTNGSIKMYNIKGRVSCTTVNGGIKVFLSESVEFDEMSFRTVNGGIQLSIPNDFAADVEISTVNGGINSELPLKISGKFNRRSIRGELNGGGGRLILKTVNGGITIDVSG